MRNHNIAVNKLIGTSVCFIEWVMQCLWWDGRVLWKLQLEKRRFGLMGNRGQSYIGSATALPDTWFPFSWLVWGSLAR